VVSKKVVPIPSKSQLGLFAVLFGLRRLILAVFGIICSTGTGTGTGTGIGSAV
jgi:hypothetical protein